MAKANMLIYLTEILFRYPQLATEFSRVFNETFTLFRDNLGTFGHIVKDENDKFDIIMSNPPYVTSGSSIIKEQIAKTPHTADQYPINGLGLESISLEWIVKSLKKGGRTYVIIPDGILARVYGKKLRNYILKECFLDAIVCLPERTFFANFERTYIIVLTKKHNSSETQIHPVFTYIVSNIGEKLTSVNRDEIEDDDLPEMEKLFTIFDATKTNGDLDTYVRCKIQPVERFREDSHWVVDRWWTPEEITSLTKEEERIATKKEIETTFKDLQTSLDVYDKLTEFAKEADNGSRAVCLGNDTLFETFIGNRYLKDELSVEEDIPVYSANVFEPMGYSDKTQINDFEKPSILWGIDGNFDFNLIPKDTHFETTDHCGTIRILDNNIVPEFVLFALHKHKQREEYGRSFRASLSNMRQIEIEIPTSANGEFDVKLQKETAEKFIKLRTKSDEINYLKDGLYKQINSYLTGSI